MRETGPWVKLTSESRKEPRGRSIVDPEAPPRARARAEGSRRLGQGHGVVRLPAPDPPQAAAGSRSHGYLRQDGEGAQAAARAPDRAGRAGATRIPAKAARGAAT